MEKHYRFTDSEFEESFSNCTFPASYFSHEAHLRLAWIHVTKYDTEKAVEHIHTQILGYAKSLGVPDKYHKTITEAAVRAVSHFINKKSFSSFELFIHEFPRLKTQFMELLTTHYSSKVIKSEKARKEYIEPDLLPF